MLIKGRFDGVSETFAVLSFNFLDSSFSFNMEACNAVLGSLKVGRSGELLDGLLFTDFVFDNTSLAEAVKEDTSGYDAFVNGDAVLPMVFVDTRGDDASLFAVTKDCRPDDSIRLDNDFGLFSLLVEGFCCLGVEGVTAAEIVDDVGVGDEDELTVFSLD
jgi:hypothetical protein